MYPSEDILATARILLPMLWDLLGDDAEEVERELRRLIARGEAGETVATQILALLTEHDETRVAARDQLVRRGAKGFAKGLGERPIRDGLGAAGYSTLRRTPHLNAPDELPTVAGSNFTIEVWTNAAPLRDVEEGEDVVIEVPPDIKRLTVGVLVTTSPHFEVEGTPYESIIIDRDRDDSGRVSFTLRVTGAGEPGEAGVFVLFVHKGRSCGSVRRRWAWDPSRPSAAAVRVEEGAESSLPVHVEATQPHLSVFITAPTHDGVHFTCSVATPLLVGREEPTGLSDWVLPEAESVADFVARGLQRMLECTTPADRKLELLSLGQILYDRAPAPFKEVLELLVTLGPRPKHIYIDSAEPTMPWELMIPSKFDDEGVQRDLCGPLGVEFAIGRWVRGDTASPPPRVQVKNSVVIAPQYQDRPLDSSEEVEFLGAHFQAEKVTPATRDGLDTYFRDHAPSVVHFVCHGAAGVEDDDAIYLEDGGELRAGILRVLKGFQKLCSDARPLVFLNSCETGRIVPLLGGAAGFPKTFGDLGARAVIAPLWPVRDVIARQVAVEFFYKRAIDEPERTLAELVRDIRKHGYDTEPFEDSFAAYCYYGDPTTALERAST